MTVFACTRCGTALTTPVSRVALPAHARREGGDRFLPPLLEPGTYAVDPLWCAPPWRPWEEIGEAAAAALGVHAPLPGLSVGPAGAVVVAPGDTRGTVLLPERCEGCCASAGGLGPNLACAGCGREVGTRIDDCYRWQSVWFLAAAVRRTPADGLFDDRVDGPSDEALDEPLDGPVPSAVEGWTVPALPPVEAPGWWSSQWEAAVGTALADLLAASGGAPVSVPDGLLTATFGRTLDALLPAGPPARTLALALAGPGLPPAPGADLLLVPRHPRTGTGWRPGTAAGSPPAGGAATVPLDAAVWSYLAFPEPRTTARLPAGVERDDPLPLRPYRPFAPDRAALLDRLARLPAVRQPWLRAIHDRLRGG
ncbi:hypothetical protein ACFYUY_35670 [Kitasatospora sp. NPDC004745]|uniref:hypothetical protein n=1 Tax=Kitasatospora sp. NPDC004745 TaxID=3364019 RepID=UPI003679DE4E